MAVREVCAAAMWEVKPYEYVGDIYGVSAETCIIVL
jgi:hypothetical protein